MVMMKKKLLHREKNPHQQEDVGGAWAWDSVFVCVCTCVHIYCVSAGTYMPHSTCGGLSISSGVSPHLLPLHWSPFARFLLCTPGLLPRGLLGMLFVSDTHSVIRVLRPQMLTLLRLAFTWLFGFWILAASDFTQPRGEFSC